MTEMQESAVRAVDFESRKHDSTKARKETVVELVLICIRQRLISCFRDSL